MSGQLVYQGKVSFVGGHPTKDMQGSMPNKSTRVVFEFFDGSKLFFNDQRKFGWIKLVPTINIKDQKFLNSLGPEPLNKSFTWQILKQNLLKHPGVNIKAALMDQTI